MARPGIHTLKFPVTKSVLWDHSHTGPANIIHINHYRNPVVTIEEKTLRILQRFSQEYNSDTYRCFLIGSLTTDQDGCGVIISVDRLETCQGRCDDVLMLSKLSPGDVSIPCVVKRNCAKPTTSLEHYENSISLLCERCAAKSKVDVSHFVALRANCSYHNNNQRFIFHIDFDMVANVLSFKTSPINPVAVVPTALSKHLTGPLSMSQIQGEPKCGYLTMDNTRKLLLVLETDPKINSLPLVGIWISGLANIQDPFVWASCLRYLFSETLQERICVPPEPFLVVLYSTVRSKPEFYECLPTDSETALDFSLSTCHEVVQLSKDYIGQTDMPIEMELIKVEHGEKMDLFNVALQKTEQRRLSAIKKRTVSGVKQSDNVDDITPRNRPAPHLTKAQVIKPSVPEVSLLLDETGDVKSGSVGPSSQYDNHTTVAGLAGMSANSALDPHRTNVSEQGRMMPVNYQYFYNDFGPPDGVQQVPYGRQSSPAQPYCNQAPHPGCPNPLRDYPACDIRQPIGPYSQTDQGQHRVSNFDTYPKVSIAGHSGANFVYPGSIPRPHISANFSPYPGQHSAANVMHYPDGNPGQWPSSMPSYPGVSQGQPPRLNFPFVTQNQGNHPGAVFTHRGISSGHNPGNESTPYPGIRTSVSNKVINSGYQPGTHQLGFYSDAKSEASDKGNRRHFVAQGRQTTGSGCAPVRTSCTPPVESISNSDHPGHRSSSTDIYHQVPRQKNYIQVSSPNGVNPIGGQSSIDRLVPNYNPKSQEVSSNSSTGSTQGNASHVKQQRPLVVEQPVPVVSPGVPHVHSGSCGNNIDTSSSGCNSGSTDSGLHSNDSADSHSDNLLMSSFGPVPQEVYERLRQQDEQLKQLQEQLAKLLAKQNSSVHDASVNTQSDGVSPGQDDEPSKEKCSVAVNTTMMWPDADNSPAGHSSLVIQRHQPQADPNDNNLAPSLPNSTNPSPQRAHQGSSHKQRQFPSPIQQCNGATLSNDSLSLGEFQLTRLHDATEESIISDMVVDLPDYTSWSPEKLGGNTSGYPDTDSNRSPVFGESVSMYEQPCINGEMNNEECDLNNGNLLANNQKKFYENLIGNVHKLLAKHADGEDTPTSSGSVCETSGHDRSVSHTSARDTRITGQLSHSEDTNVDVAEITRQRLRELGVDLDNCYSNDTSNNFRSDQSFYINSVLLPKVNYMSMMFESSDSDLSHDANALAMKYLSDEQLSALALHQGSPRHLNKRHPCLDRITNDAKSDISLCGISSNHMSFATRKYLERYGLINDGGPKDETHDAEPVLRDHPALANVQQYLNKLNDRSLNGSVSSHSDDKNQTVSDRQQHTYEQGKYHSDGESFSSEYTSSTHSHPSGPPVDKLNQTPQTGTKNKRTAHVNRSAKPKYEHQQFDMHDDSPVVAARVLDIERLKKLPKLL